MLALLLTALLALQDKTITFTGPDKAKSEDLKKAASALEARCKAFGYEGITCAVKKGLVEVSSQNPLTAPMHQRIVILARLHAGAVRLLMTRRMTQAEVDQYPGPATNASDPKAASPKGMRWFKEDSFVYPGGSGVWRCVFEPGEVKASDILEITVAEQGIRVKIGPAGQKIAVDHVQENDCTAYLLAQNGRVITERVWIKEAGAQAVAEADPEARVAIQHPLPFPLTTK